MKENKTKEKVKLVKLQDIYNTLRRHDKICFTLFTIVYLILLLFCLLQIKVLVISFLICSLVLSLLLYPVLLCPNEKEKRKEEKK